MPPNAKSSRSAAAAAAADTHIRYELTATPPRHDHHGAAGSGGARPASSKRRAPRRSAREPGAADDGVGGAPVFPDPPRPPNLSGATDAEKAARLAAYRAHADSYSHRLEAFHEAFRLYRIGVVSRRATANVPDYPTRLVWSRRSRLGEAWAGHPWRPMPAGPIVDRRAGPTATVLLWALPVSHLARRRRGHHDATSLLLAGEVAPMAGGGDGGGARRGEWTASSASTAPSRPRPRLRRQAPPA